MSDKITAVPQNPLLKGLWYIDQALQRVLKVISSTFILTIVLLVFLQIVLRYGFRFSFRWVEEVSRWLLIGATMQGAALAYRYRGLTGVQALTDRLPAKVQKALAYICDLLVLGFSAVVLLSSHKLISMIVEYDQRSAATRLPMWIAYMSIPVGAACILFFAVVFLTFSVCGVEDGIVPDTWEVEE